MMINVRTVRTAVGVGLMAAMAIGVGACGAGGATHAGTASAVVSPTPQSDASGVPGAGAAPALAQAAATQAQPAAPAAASTTPKTAPTVARTAGPITPKATAPAPTVTTPAPTTPALPARRQPSAAEVKQVIASVHALVPLFTPTPAQIATAGNQVCTAFDQGKTVAQVKAAAMQMAGAYAALVPPGVADTAVRTIVTLYCPGYASKLV